jgi:hypothetical protein
MTEEHILKANVKLDVDKAKRQKYADLTNGRESHFSLSPPLLGCDDPIFSFSLGCHSS